MCLRYMLNVPIVYQPLDRKGIPEATSLPKREDTRWVLKSLDVAVLCWLLTALLGISWQEGVDEGKAVVQGCWSWVQDTR